MFVRVEYENIDILPFVGYWDICDPEQEAFKDSKRLSDGERRKASLKVYITKPGDKEEDRVFLCHYVNGVKIFPDVQPKLQPKPKKAFTLFDVLVGLIAGYLCGIVSVIVALSIFYK